uniref:Uncharacterized protein n=1 Tax=Opuntia streptacantha TaxID=393608 RepID=A0A7C9APS4_OPUST
MRKFNLHFYSRLTSKYRPRRTTTHALYRVLASTSNQFITSTAEHVSVRPGCSTLSIYQNRKRDFYITRGSNERTAFASIKVYNVWTIRAKTPLRRVHSYPHITDPMCGE